MPQTIEVRLNCIRFSFRALALFFGIRAFRANDRKLVPAGQRLQEERSHFSQFRTAQRLAVFVKSVLDTAPGPENLLSSRPVESSADFLVPYLKKQNVWINRRHVLDARFEHESAHNPREGSDFAQ